MIRRIEYKGMVHAGEITNGQINNVICGIEINIWDASTRILSEPTSGNDKSGLCSSEMKRCSICFKE